MKPARALVPAALASAIWYAFLVAAGSLLAHNWEAVKATVADTNRALGFVALAVTAAFAFWIWRRSRERR
jgi:membrane protein DedA with SNARE-associated domain